MPLVSERIYDDDLRERHRYYLRECEATRRLFPRLCVQGHPASTSRTCFRGHPLMMSVNDLRYAQYSPLRELFQAPNDPVCHNHCIITAHKRIEVASTLGYLNLRNLTPEESKAAARSPLSIHSFESKTGLDHYSGHPYYFLL